MPKYGQKNGMLLVRQFPVSALIRHVVREERAAERDVMATAQRRAFLGLARQN
jgi:hypothetical protein